VTSFGLGEPIILLQNGAPVADEYGDPIPSQTPVTVTGGFNPGTSAENPGQDTATTRPSVYLPSGTDVSWVDAVQVRGVTYQVDGSPNDWISPFTGTQFGIEVRLRGVLAEPR
jgi:hypothetical protein